MRDHGLHGKEPPINPYIWCAVGAVLGWLAGAAMASSTRTARIEEVLVGVFGAFIGGEFVTAMLNDGKAVDTFSMGGLLNALIGAAVLLFLLSVMRKAVGPMRPHKKPRGR